MNRWPQMALAGGCSPVPRATAETIDLNRNDAPRTVSHSLGAKRRRPAVSQATSPDNFGPETWTRFLSCLPVAGALAYIRSNSYDTAALYVLDDESTDYLAGWTIGTAELWASVMDEVAHRLVGEFADDTGWRSGPTASRPAVPE